MAPDVLLAKVNRYLTKTGETPTVFSKRVSNDPALVLKMRRGRQLRYETMQKVLEAIRG